MRLKRKPDIEFMEIAHEFQSSADILQRYFSWVQSKSQSISKELPDFLDIQSKLVLRMGKQYEIINVADIMPHLQVAFNEVVEFT